MSSHLTGCIRLWEDRFDHLKKRQYVGEVTWLASLANKKKCIFSNTQVFNIIFSKHDLDNMEEDPVFLMVAVMLLPCDTKS